MKTLLTLFVLLFSSSVVADDISDFEIEGMSLGDNILDYFSEKQLINFSRSYFKGYNGIEVFSDVEKNHQRYFELENFDSIQVAYNKDSADFFKIVSIVGQLWFIDDIEGCLRKQKEIKSGIENTIKSILLRKQEVVKDKHAGDKSGKSFVTGTEYYLSNDDELRLMCYDWDNATNWWDHLRLGIDLKEYLELLDTAYN